MEITGTIYRILQNQEVTFNDGTKKMKGGFVIMREGDYPRPVAFELFGEERLTMLNGLTTGILVRVSFTAESRESKTGNYYTTLRCFNITSMAAASTPTPPSANTNPDNIMASSDDATKQQTQSPIEMPEDNDLPFDNDLEDV